MRTLKRIRAYLHPAMLAIYAIQAARLAALGPMIAVVATEEFFRGIAQGAADAHHAKYRNGVDPLRRN